ncbi:MAG: carboxypeptidase regulatory-like domain-containing protein, partial [bacterium]
MEVSGAGVRTSTDAQGNYRLQIPSGAHFIFASKEGYVTAQRGPLEVEPGARLQNVNFTLTNNAAVVSGAVRRGGDPVFEAIVIATRVEDGAQFTVTSDRQGNYTLNIRSGTYRLTAQKPGLVAAPPGVWEIALQPGQRVENRNIPMLNWSARIIGRVTSPGGAVPSPHLEIIDLNQPQRVFRSSGNAEGFYQVSVEPNTRFIVIARKEGFSSGRDTARALEPEQEETINLQLQPLPAQLSGTVTSGERGLGGVRIDARGQGQSFQVESDPDGRYRLSLPAGEFLMTASRPGYQSAETTVTAVAGQEQRGINLRLRENFARVSGSVTTTGGSPINGAEVALMDSISGRTSLTRSSADGFFAFDRLLPGSFILTVSHPQFRRTSLNLGAVVGGQERRGIEVRMTPLQAAIFGRIEDQEGQAVAEATIFATDPSGDEFLSTSDNEGRYRLLP